MEHVSAELARVVDAAEILLRQVSEEESAAAGLTRRLVAEATAGTPDRFRLEPSPAIRESGAGRCAGVPRLRYARLGPHTGGGKRRLADAGGPLGQLQPLSGPRDSPPARRQTGSCVPDRVEYAGFASISGRGLCETPGASSPGSDRRCEAVVTAQAAAPGDDSQLGLRGIGQHAQELQLVAIRVLKVDGSCRHPGQHHWLIGRAARKVAW